MDVFQIPGGPANEFWFMDVLHKAYCVDVDNMKFCNAPTSAGPGVHDVLDFNAGLLTEPAAGSSVNENSRVYIFEDKINIFYKSSGGFVARCATYSGSGGLNNCWTAPAVQAPSSPPSDSGNLIMDIFLDPQICSTCTGIPRLCTIGRNGPAGCISTSDGTFHAAPSDLVTALRQGGSRGHRTVTSAFDKTFFPMYQ